MTQVEYDSRPDTLKHIGTVRMYLYLVIADLKYRADKHDETKLDEPEKSIFDRCTPHLRELEYDSPEYRGYLKSMGKALDHHYAHNDHHPEHYENGIQGMTLMALTEMTVDWIAATKRHDTGDIRRSIEQNQKRFGYSDELKQIILNTVEALGE